MFEEAEEKAAQPFEIGRYLDILRRRHLVFLMLLLVGWLAVWGASWFLPSRYKSSTLILVEEPALPKDYVVPNVNSKLQDRLQSITQQILSRTRLLLIINKQQLYRNARHALTPDEQVERMRKDIDFELVKDPQSSAITAFRIFYTAPSPQIAQQVTSELTNLFINENLKVRESESENTTQFLEAQLVKARATLSDQEARVREFQTAHEGELPTQETTNLQILSGLQAQLQNEQDALNAARQQNVYHQSLIAQYRALNGTHRTASGAPSGLERIDQQLEKLRSRLQDLTARYTDQYPEVQEVKADIAQAEKDRQQTLTNLKKNPEEKQAGGLSQETVEPAQSALLLQLQSQLQANQVEITNRERAVSSLEARINQYQGSLNREPAVSQQLADLTRGYEQSQANYNDLLKKENNSQMATSMEQMQEGERFTMLDPPSLSLRPSSPNRLKMCEMGLAAGVGLGLLAVLALEFLDDRLHNEREIINLLPVGILSEIPSILTPDDTKRKQWRTALGWAMVTLVVGVILSGSAFSYLHS